MSPKTKADAFYSSGHLTGTYSIKGGCADGDQGNVPSVKIPFIANILNGTFTTSGAGTFDLAGDVAQNAGASSATAVQEAYAT